MQELTQERLKELLNYDPATGIFTWKISPAKKNKAGDIAGSIGSGRYRQIRIYGTLYYSHRLAWLYMTGELPVNHIDHINHERADNRWCNLRDVTEAENNKNRSMNRNNKIGHTGVYWHKTACKWQAMITHAGKLTHIGLFDTVEEASAAYQIRAAVLGYHVNHGT